jgi:hypothetical protein
MLFRCFQQEIITKKGGDFLTKVTANKLKQPIKEIDCLKILFGEE